MEIDAEFRGLDEAFDALTRALEPGVREGLERIAEAVAVAAATEHPYTDRTGNLTASIEATPATGTLADGTLTATVVAGEEYASYVDERPEYAFLKPARRRIEQAGEAARALDAALDRAAHDAGWV